MPLMHITMHCMILLINVITDIMLYNTYIHCYTLRKCNALKTFDKQAISDGTRNLDIMDFNFGYNYLEKYIMHYNVHY